MDVWAPELCVAAQIIKSYNLIKFTTNAAALCSSRVNDGIYLTLWQPAPRNSLCPQKVAQNTPNAHQEKQWAKHKIILAPGINTFCRRTAGNYCRKYLTRGSEGVKNTVALWSYSFQGALN